MIQKGSKVSIHYTLKVEGEVVDSSVGQDPLNYEHGSGDIIPGLEEQLEGLKRGDKKTFIVSPEKAYGQHNPQAVEKLPRSAFKEAGEIQVGQVVSGQVGDQPFQATIVEANTDEVTLDLNHPLAGKTLNFEVEIMAIE